MVNLTDKELKDLARKNINKKIPEGVTQQQFETATDVVNVKRNRGNFKPEVVHETLTRLKIDTANITFEKPRQFGTKPEAFDILEAYLRDKIITQAQFDSFFEEEKFVVTVKPKSNMALALTRIGEGE